MGRRKKRKIKLYIFFIILVILLAIFLIVYKNTILKNVNNNNNKKVNNSMTTTKKNNGDNISKDNEKSDSESTKENTISSDANNVTEKSSSDEGIENKNEQTRKGGVITLELIGEEEITIFKGSNYKDAGVKATYSDGSDASSVVEVDNDVDTSKVGTYTVTYYVGNSIVIRRVTVK